MKKLIVVTGLLLAGIFFTAFTPTDGPFEDVVSAIKQGNTDSLHLYLDKTVSINIAGRSSSYTKAQAEIILKEFFSKNVVKSFVITHQGQAGGGSRYGIGNLSTSGGDFVLSFFLQKSGKKVLLNELKFKKVS